jgi:CO/xanthine dehydrogenase Mo-binding subunit
VQITLDAQRISGNPMEPKACTVAYDAATDSYDVYMQTQGMSDIQSALAHVTGLPPDRFRVHARTSAAASASATRSIRRTSRSCWPRRPSSGR